jgi:hypothetical protein
MKVRITGTAKVVATKEAEDEVADFFLAGREMGTLAVAASLFSSNIGSEHFVGLAGAGAESGLAVSGFEWSAGFMLMMLGWAFFPAYFSSHTMTTPLWLQSRFGGRRIRLVVSVLSLLLYCFTKISATLYAGGVILETLLGWDIYVSSAALILSTGACVAAARPPFATLTRMNKLFVTFSRTHAPFLFPSSVARLQLTWSQDTHPWATHRPSLVINNFDFPHSIPGTRRLEVSVLSCTQRCCRRLHCSSVAC